MKLVSFSPWQHTTTSMPSTKNGADDIVQNLIMSPSNFGNYHHKRTSSSSQSASSRRKNNNKKKEKTTFRQSLSSSTPDSSDIQPIISITSNHQMCVLGHHHMDHKKNNNNDNTSLPKKILRPPSQNNNDETNLELKQVPQWIYNSRPDPTSSFFPQKSSSIGNENASAPGGKTNYRKVGAVVDPSSRHIFILQNNNQTLKVWNLDDDVVGPDDDYSEQDSSNGSSNHRKIIKAVDFDSAVVCMENIPMKQRQIRRVKIKGAIEHHGDNNTTDDIIGGVTGVLSNGQMFVVLVCSNSNTNNDDDTCIKLGLYGDTTVHVDDSEYMHSVVGLVSSPSELIPTTTSALSSGQKRKLDNNMNNSGDNDGGWGELSLAVLSRNRKSQDTLTLTKHIVSISSLESSDMDVDDLPYAKIGGGEYVQQDHSIQLLNLIGKDAKNGKGSKHGKSKDIFVTQLDSTHIGLVYCTTDNTSCATIVDTKVGDCILTPFQLTRANDSSTTSVTGIGGLSSSILAVLTSDSIICLYDLRRAVKLHEVKISDALGMTENGVKHQYSIASNWFTGTICIICNTVGSKGYNGGNNVTISYARVGVYDSQSADVVETGRKPFLKGAYNLARIIASSKATEDFSMFQSEQLNVNQIAADISDWFPSDSTTKKKLKLSYEGNVSEIISDLERYRSGEVHQQNGKRKKKDKKSFLQAFEEMKKKLLQVQSLSPSSKKKTGKKAKSKAEPISYYSLRTIPQAVIDVSVSVAISVIFTKTNDHTQTSNAMNVLLQCIKSGLVSGRNHFDHQAIHHKRRNGDTLRHLLLTLQAHSKDKKGTTTRSSCSPLDLISNLLQHCKDGLTEQMLVSMIHFVLCHATEEQFAHHWKESQSSLSSSSSTNTANEWYTDSVVKVLEKRLVKAQTTQTEDENEKNDEDVQRKLVDDLETRLAVSRQLHFIEKIVTHSKCNPALLRIALQNGLTQVEAGEIGVLIQALGKILRRAGKEKKDKSTTTTTQASATTNSAADDDRFFGEYTPNKSTCISQWLSALIDSNLANLMQTNDKTIQQAQKEVSASIAQTKAVLSLKELIYQMDRLIDDKKKDNTNSGSSSSKKMEVMSVPLYGIEQLIF